MPTIVVIDDNELICKLIRLIFRPYINFEVFTASSAAQGMVMILEKMPDVVILDVDLQDANITGIDIYNAIKKNKCFDKVSPMIITATEIESLLEHVVKDTLTEPTPYMLKPFTQESLIGEVLMTLGMRSHDMILDTQIN